MPSTLGRSRRQVPHLSPTGARESARWAVRQMRRSFLAEWWGVHETRVSHRAREGHTCVAETCQLIEDPQANGPAIFAAVGESLERRFAREAGQDRGAAETRLRLLLDREHQREAAQNRALQAGEGEEEACLAHASDLIEIAMWKRALREVAH